MKRGAVKKKHPTGKLSSRWEGVQEKISELERVPPPGNGTETGDEVREDGVMGPSVSPRGGQWGGS